MRSKIDLQGTKPNAQPQAVLREFMSYSGISKRKMLLSFERKNPPGILVMEQLQSILNLENLR